MLLLAGVVSASATPVESSSYAWRVERPKWSPADESGYAAFIGALYRADCHTVADCLSAPHNPLAADDPPGLAFSADCADLVYMLRAYYAWKHGLPFGFVTEIEARASQGESDLRQTQQGNRPVARWDVAVDPAADIRDVFRVIRDQVSTATFRMDPALELSVPQDFYSPAITRDALRPGTALYNGDGHVVIVAEIDDAGRIHFIDAHPDTSITRGVYGGQFERGDPVTGAGFHAWRPVAVHGTALVHAANVQMTGYSLEQYYGPNAATDWRAADFSDDGRNADFVEFTRRRLSKGLLRYDVLEEADLGFAELCDSFQDRARAVTDAIERDLPRAPRPGRLGGVSQEEQVTWFAYSTPGRDRRLRGHTERLARSLARMIERRAAGHAEIHYRGTALDTDLSRLFASHADACRFSYRNSDGQPVELTMRDGLARLADLSFDPWHCAERRWGAEGGELARCDDDPAKAGWYAAQAVLRTTADTDGVPPNPTLDELAAQPSSAWKAPDFEAIFRSARPQP